MNEVRPAHSLIGASSMYRWSKCPGSVRLSRTMPPAPESEYAKEGTLAHTVAAHYLEHGVWLPEAHEEMKEAVQVYIDAIKDDLKKAYGKESYTQFIEKSFDLSKVYPGLYGTGDFAVYYPRRKFLRFYDYKHGAGIPVEVVGNLQLRYYALGVARALGYEVNEVEIVVVQPRCVHPDGPVRREAFPGSELDAFEKKLVAFAKATEDPNAKLVPGEHCRFCPAVAVCEAVHDKAMTLARQEFGVSQNYDAAKLGRVLEALPAIEAWISGVREFAYGEAQHGRIPPGFKLVAKRANRSWKGNVTSEILAMCLEVDEEKLIKQTLLTPAQVEKLLPKAMAKELAGFTQTVSSGTSLVPLSDKREAIKNDPASEFKNLELENLL